MANLKFNKGDFEEQDTLNLLINLLANNCYPTHRLCKACETYSSFCKKNLKKRRDANRGDFDLVIGKIEKSDQCDYKYKQLFQCHKMGNFR